MLVHAYFTGGFDIDEEYEGELLTISSSDAVFMVEFVSALQELIHLLRADNPDNPDNPKSSGLSSYILLNLIKTILNEYLDNNSPDNPDSSGQAKYTGIGRALKEDLIQLLSDLSTARKNKSTLHASKHVETLYTLETLFLEVIRQISVSLAPVHHMWLKSPEALEAALQLAYSHINTQQGGNLDPKYYQHSLAICPNSPQSLNSPGCGHEAIFENCWHDRPAGVHQSYHEYLLQRGLGNLYEFLLYYDRFKCLDIYQAREQDILAGHIVDVFLNSNSGHYILKLFRDETLDNKEEDEEEGELITKTKSIIIRETKEKIKKRYIYIYIYDYYVNTRNPEP